MPNAKKTPNWRHAPLGKPVVAERDGITLYRYGSRSCVWVIAAPSDPKKYLVMGTARHVSAGNESGWLLRVAGHVWKTEPGHPFIPAGKDWPIKRFRSWRQANVEARRIIAPYVGQSYEGFKEPIRENAVLAYWHDTGAMGATLAYVRVLKLGKVKIRVRYETSFDEAWVYPHKFDHVVSGKTLDELLADGVKV